MCKMSSTRAHFGPILGPILRGPSLENGALACMGCIFVRKVVCAKWVARSVQNELKTSSFWTHVGTLFEASTLKMELSLAWGAFS